MDLMTLEYTSPDASVSKKEWARVDIPSSLRCAALNADESALVAGCADGTLIVYDRIMGSLTKKDSGEAEPQFVCWHPEGGFFVVSYSTAEGKITFFDAAINPLQVCSPSTSAPALYLEVGPALGHQARLYLGKWTQNLSQPNTNNLRHRLALAYDRGPVIVLEIESGIFNKGRLSAREILYDQLACGHTHEACDLLRATHSSEECVRLGTALVNRLLLANTVSWTDRALEAVEFLRGSHFQRQREAIENLYRRVCAQLLRERRLEEAFNVASALELPDLFLLIASWSERMGESIVADIVWSRLAPLLAGFERPNPLREKEDGAGREASHDICNPRIQGILLEAEGRYAEALEVFNASHNTRDASRIMANMSIMQEQASNLSISSFQLHDTQSSV
mmetsp:Transcript_16429/g.27114  ORF Transcript_16429/g.27114 Transcript_16429/m.27114 type:complete len:395 (-) Transcript_16429:631-1815(-)